MFKKLSRMLAVVAAAILMLTAVGTAVQAEEAVTGDQIQDFTEAVPRSGVILIGDLFLQYYQDM